MEFVMRCAYRLILSLVVTAGAACAPVAPVRHDPSADEITVDMLLENSPIEAGAELPDLSRVDILELDPKMIAFIEEHVNENLSPPARLKSLLTAVMGQDHFELIYDDSTRTASETFQERHGNCLSFTNMFVAMARHLGLDASYQEIEISPDWSSAGQAFLISQHVNVYIDFRHYSPRVVDFNFSYDPTISRDFDLVYDREVIPDNRARAHYFNNMGVEKMLLAGDTPLAFAYYREGLREDVTFSPAWINLGILYRRDGHLEYAEAAYMQALAHDPSSLVTMSNLAALYEQRGQPQQAEYYRDQARAHRMKNPYYRYSLAQTDVIEGNYKSAREHLKFAISRREDEARFYVLMSISYSLSGDQEAASKWMKQAEALAAEDSDRARYHHKLEMLMNMDPGQRD